MSGFSFVPMGDGTDITVKQPLAPSQTILKGYALTRTNGLLYRASAQTDIIHAIAKEDLTSASTESPDIKVILTQPDRLFKVPITPLVDDTLCDTNSTKGTAIITSATFSGLSNDNLNGGIIYSKTINEAAVITDSAISSTTFTLTLAKNMTEALSTSHYARVFVLGLSVSTLKLNSSTPYSALGNTVADKSSGKVTVHLVDPKNRFAFVSFNRS